MFLKLVKVTKSSDNLHVHFFKNVLNSFRKMFQSQCLEGGELASLVADVYIIDFEFTGIVMMELL